MSCSWWRIPIHSGPLRPLLETNCPHPYIPNPSLTPHHPLGPVLNYNDNVNDFSLLDLEQLHTIYVISEKTKYVYFK
jgi:hypothetical protein